MTNSSSTLFFFFKLIRHLFFLLLFGGKSVLLSLAAAPGLYDEVEVIHPRVARSRLFSILPYLDNPIPTGITS